MNYLYTSCIQQWLIYHRDSIIKLLSSFVSVPSVVNYGENGYSYGTACHSMMDLYQHTAEQLGFQTERYDDDAVVVYDSFDPSKKTIGIWAHLDVVPAGKDWDADPFTLREKEGFLIGRGCSDNKSAAAGGLALLLCLREIKINTGCNFKIFASCDEECGSQGVINYVRQHTCPDYSIVPDSGFPVCYGEKGIMNVTVFSEKAVSENILALSGGTVANMIPDFAQLRVKKTGTLPQSLPDGCSVTEENGCVLLSASGIAGHAAHPAGSVNAIDKLLRFLSIPGILSENDRTVFANFQKLFTDNEGTSLGIASSDELSGNTTCVGTILSMKDGHVQLGFNIRYCISADSEKLRAAIEEKCAEHGCALSYCHDSKPNYFDPSSPIVKKLTEVFCDLSGEQKEPYVMSGGTYARKIPNAFVFGLGGLPRPECSFLKKSHGGAHQPNEVLHIDTYFKALNIFFTGMLEADSIVSKDKTAD